MTIGSSGKLIKRWRCGAAGAGAGPHKSLSDGRCRTRKKSSHFHGCLRSKLKAASGGHNFLLAFGFGIVFLYLHPPKAHRSVAFCGWIVHAWYGGKKERSNSTDNNSLSGCFQPAALLPTVLVFSLDACRREISIKAKQSKAKQRPALHFDKMGRNVLRQPASHVGDRTNTMTWLGMWKPRPTMLLASCCPVTVITSSGSNLYLDRASV